MFLFGIPGFGFMVIFIGVFVLLGLGIDVGLSFLENNFDFIYLIVWLFVFVNVVGMVMCILFLG